MIWKKKIEIKKINENQSNTMAEFLNIIVTDVGKDFIKAKMPVNEKTKQPFGILNGGASVTLAETIGSIASNLCLIDPFYAVGIEINANHIKSVSSGHVIGITRPIHLGKSTHVWETRLTQNERITCISRLTTAVLKNSVSS